MLRRMLSGEFVEMMIILTCIYYVVVLIRYYRKELKPIIIRSHITENPDEDAGG